jgi:hypothetical protein
VLRAVSNIISENNDAFAERDPQMDDEFELPLAAAPETQTDKAPDAVEPATDCTLTDLIDQMDRAAFRRALAGRGASPIRAWDGSGSEG